MLELNHILQHAVQVGASDTHLVPGHYPMMEVHKHLEAVQQFEVITPQDSERMCAQMIGAEGMKGLAEKRDWDFSYTLPGVCRFRVNAHYQRGVIGLCFRTISAVVPELEVLGLPPIVQQFAHVPRGLILVTGPTGSGKSTTLASLIQRINTTQRKHIITVEDPVEYELTSQSSLIEQRELGQDVPSFASGLKHALRQAPDVILVGEMRDLETTSAAITAAETGHLVFSTLHTQSASQTIERIVDIYPGDQQRYILSLLANTLQAVVTQTLFKRADGAGMIPALEVMTCSNGIRNCIRENRLHEIPNIIETSRQLGMCSMDESIKALYLNGYITLESALEKTLNPAKFRKSVGV